MHFFLDTRGMKTFWILCNSKYTVRSFSNRFSAPGDRPTCTDGVQTASATHPVFMAWFVCAGESLQTSSSLFLTTTPLPVPEFVEIVHPPRVTGTRAFVG